MVAEAVVVSSLPFRVRLRVPERRGDRAYFEDLLSRIEALGNVIRVSANPTTGSVLIVHEGGFDELADALREAELEIIEAAFDEPSHHLGDVTRAGTFALAGAFAALGLMQLGRRQALPPALTLLWYAGSLAAKVLGAPRRT